MIPSSPSVVVPPDPGVHLIACPDDYLLQRAVDDAVRAAANALAVEPELLPEDATPQDLAFELGSRSLFAAHRLLVCEDIASWLSKGRGRGSASAELEPLLARLAGGPEEDTVVILGACSSREPSGALVDAISKAGSVRWLPLPPPPKPWEDTVLSQEQRAVLRQVLTSEAPDLRLTRAAEQLLLDRLGFSPRLLAQEARTLAAAASGGGEVDEALVRRLSFPLEQSLDVVRESVLQRSPANLLGLLAAAAAGQPVQDWRGQRMAAAGVPVVVAGQVAALLIQLLYIRRLCRSLGLHEALDTTAISARRWYPTVFKPRYAPRLREAIQSDPGAPFAGQKPPSEWALSQLVAGAARYTDSLLVRLLAEAGEVEAASRGTGANDRLTAWCARLTTDSSV